VWVSTQASVAVVRKPAKFDQFVTLRRTQPLITTLIVLVRVALPSRFQPPEKFAPFLLSPGLCYNNALENAASAMEVAAVAAKNCALLVQQHVQQLDQQRHLTGAALNMAVV
jgi:hypothetical protein